MNLQTLQSKINVLRARINQFEQSGLFTEQEIEKYTYPLRSDLAQLEDMLKEHPVNVGEIEVNNPEML